MMNLNLALLHVDYLKQSLSEVLRWKKFAEYVLKS